MIELDKLEESFKSKMLCRFCDGTGINDWEKQKLITLFGMTPNQIMDMWKFSEEHGWDSLNHRPKD